MTTSPSHWLAPRLAGSARCGSPGRQNTGQLPAARRRGRRFRRTCERRDASASRETASAGPSPAQLTELRLLYTITRSRGFPRRRTGSRNRRPCRRAAFSLRGISVRRDDYRL